MGRMDTCTLWRECIACKVTIIIIMYNYVHVIKNVV